MIDPSSATARSDLSWLRHRTRRVAPMENPALSDFIHTGGHAHPHVPDHLPPTPVDSSLDLSTPAPSARTAAPVIAAPTVVQQRLPAPRRARPGQQTILTHDARTVTLNRLQSAIGALTIEAACSAEVGDLKLACAFQLASGASSLVVLDGGSRFGPKDAQRPIIVASRDRFETIALDLRQLPALERLAIIAFSHSRQQLRWGGTLLVTTFGGAKVEIPIDLPATGQVAVLLTSYNVSGELVLRSQLDAIDGSVRGACKAFGFDRISWLDDRTPVD